MKSKWKNKIHAVYFSSRKHFDLLYISLNSLRLLNLPFLGCIYLYIDKSDFLTDRQFKLLNRLRLTLKIREVNKVTQSGEMLIYTELRAFKDISEEVSPEDYMAKIDSDVLFLSRDIFLEVLRSNKDVIGQECNVWDPFIYFQGGCYFIKCALVPNIVSFDKDLPEKVLKYMNSIAIKKGYMPMTSCPEDAFIYHIIKARSESIRLTDFYGTWNDLFQFNKRISAIHFENVKKEDMWRLRGLEAIVTKNSYVRALILRLLIILPRGVKATLRTMYDSWVMGKRKKNGTFINS